MNWLEEIEKRDSSSGYIDWIGYASKDVFICSNFTNMDARNNARFLAAAPTDTALLISTLREAIKTLEWYSTLKFQRTPK